MVECAENEASQSISLHGQSVAVVLSQAMFDRLTGKELSLVDFMRRSPLYNAEDVVFQHDTSQTRAVSF
jgi:hypothetical protein